MPNPTTSDAQAIIDVATAAAEPVKLTANERYSVVVPAGGSVKEIDTEGLGLVPARARGAYAVSTLMSFEDYLSRHGDGDSTVWVHPTTGRAVAVIDDNGPAVALGMNTGWGDHTLAFDPILTEAWKRWLELDGALVDQEQFAEHLEDGLAEIREPDGATLLEVAQSIHGTTKATWRAAKRLHDGTVQMQWDEEQQAKAGVKGDLTIPTTFHLALTPFIGHEPLVLVARLRYRISGGALKIGYRLENPQELLIAAVAAMTARLEGKFPNVYIGKPPVR